MLIHRLIFLLILSQYIVHSLHFTYHKHFNYYFIFIQIQSKIKAQKIRLVVVEEDLIDGRAELVSRNTKLSLCVCLSAFLSFSFFIYKKNTSFLSLSLSLSVNLSLCVYPRIENQSIPLSPQVTHTGMLEQNECIRTKIQQEEREKAQQTLKVTF